MEGHSSRTIVHRVVFYDLLSRPGQEVAISPHLSIPLAPGLESVWAPNGYGKTFAMKLLEKIRFPSPESDERLGSPQYWLGRFLKEARSEVIEPSDQMTRSSFSSMNPIEADVLSFNRGWRDGEIPRMVPFSKMMIRFVTLDENDSLRNVEDLWVDAEDWLSGEDDWGCYLTRFDYEGICLHDSPDLLASSHLPMDRELFEMINAFAESSEIDVSRMNEAHHNRFVGSDEYSFMPSVIPKPWDFRASMMEGKYRKQSQEKTRDIGLPSGFSFNVVPITKLNPMSVDYYDMIPEKGDVPEYRDFSLTREYQLLHIMSQMRVKYVEIPKECHGSESDPLQKCQDLISSMIDLALSYDDKIDETDRNLNVLSPLSRVKAEERFEHQYAILDELRGFEGRLYPDYTDKHEEYFHEVNYEEGEEVISDEEVQSAIDQESQALSRLRRSQLIILDIVQSTFDRINDAIMTSKDDPWARRVSSWRSRSIKELRRSPMRFERPMFRDYVDPNTLSFGQRSAIVLECWLGYMALMEFTNNPSAMDGTLSRPSPRTCLVLDEPEAGRSEHSVDSLSFRLSEARELVGVASDNSLLVMSHRRDVLEAVGDGGRFHLMQQFDDDELGHDSEE